MSGKAENNIPASFTFELQPTVAFNMASVRPGVPGVFDPNDSMAIHRDWDFNFRNYSDGFSSIRWCPSWIRTDSNLAYWEPAGADIYRVQRKGAAGADLQTLVFTCSPSTADIPNGEQVVIWEADSDVSVVQTNSKALSGYNLPLRSKLSVAACTPSLIYDVDGRQVVEIMMGQNLPSIDYTPGLFTTNGVEKSSLQMRHWSFYKDTANKILRHPIAHYSNLTMRALAGGAYVMLGGNQWAPGNYDWSRDYFNFGASLTEDLFTQECEALADIFGNTSTNKLAVELEAKVFHGWQTIDTVPGYKLLMNDLFYPIARNAWGSDRTIVVKPSGGLSGVIEDFDWECPKGANVNLVSQATDGEISGPDGVVDFNSLAETDWLAEEFASKVNDLGFSGGGIIDLTVNNASDVFEKGKAFGRVLTSFNNKGLYTFFNGASGVFTIDGSRIEALFPEMRSRARRAGLVES